MVDRTIIYTNELPRSADILQFQKDVVYAIGYLAQAVLGQPGSPVGGYPPDILPGNSYLDGLVVAPTQPASLQVTVGSGSIYQMDPVDATSYGVLSTDSNVILKQGLILTPATLTITPPATSGYSQYYLIEAIYQDLDTGSTVLPYFNSLNPLQPFAGPANSGTPQYTLRQGLCTIALKPGVAAPSGSQIIPTPDAGYTGIATVLVINGQTQIISNNIATYNYFPDTPAPFITPKLPMVPPAIQAQKDNYVQDTGTANAMAVTLPQWTSLVAGLTLRIRKGANVNTGPMTLSVNSGTAYTVQWGDTSALLAGDWPASDIGIVIFDGSEWQLVSMPGPTVFSRISGPLSGLVHWGVDTGTVNDVSVTSVTPSISSVTQGMQFEIQKIATTNTGAMTVTIQGTASTLFWADGSVMQGGDWPGTAIAIIVYDGANYRLESVMGPTVYQRVLPAVALVHFGVASGTNTLTTTTTPSFPSMVDGIIIELETTAANTGAVTLAPNGLAAAAVQLPSGGALPAGTFQASTSYLLGALGGVWKLLANYYAPGAIPSSITNIQVLTNTGTYTPTAGAQKGLVFCTGGGGSGGVSVSCGAGGGAGATAIVLFSISGTVSYTIGAGASGVTAGYNGSAVGGTGGTTSFGSYATAGGGTGGGPYDVGGPGGAATVGTMLIYGGDGHTAGAGTGYDSANGGASFWGGGGKGGPSSTSGPGSPGRAYGSGGGGTDAGYSSSSGRTSGAGKAGVILVVEF
jgi:hypothetical protein